MSSILALREKLKLINEQKAKNNDTEESLGYGTGQLHIVCNDTGQLHSIGSNTEDKRSHATTTTNNGTSQLYTDSMHHTGRTGMQAYTAETGRQPVFTSGGITQELADCDGTEHIDDTAWVNRIFENGNQPEHWLEYINSVKSSIDLGNKEKNHRYYHYLCSLYERSFKAMSSDNGHRKKEPYAKLLINYAQLKSEIDDPDEARFWFTRAKTNAKYFAIAHIAAAQFELSQGNVSKCKKILESGREAQAKPVELLHIAFKNLVNSKPLLLPESDKMKVITQGKSEVKDLPILQPKKSWFDRVEKSSQGVESRTTGRHTTKSDRYNTLPITIPATGAESSVQQKKENTITFKESSDPNGKRQTASGDDSDTVPMVYEKLPESDSNGKPALRTYHSTPECKSFGQSNLTGNRSITLGRPLRIKRSSLPQVNERLSSHNDDDSEEDDVYDSVKPLPGTDYQHHHNAPMEMTIQTIPVSPPATSDSGIMMGHVPMEFERQVSRMELDRQLSRDVQPMDVEHDFHKLAISGTQDVVDSSHVKVEVSVPKVELSVERGTDGAVNSTDVPRQTPFHHTRGSEPMHMPTPMPCPTNTPGNLAPHGHVATPRGTVPYGAIPHGAIVTPGGAVPHSTLIPQQYYNPVMPAYSQQPNYLGQATPFMANPNDVITVNGKMYTILKCVGRGGSSKVYRVLDFEKNVLAVKSVNLEGADDATIEGYKNEITLLKRLQKYPEKVVKMYDYEYSQGINKLFVVMENGDADLATLFRNRSKQGEITDIMKQFYWEEMLKAVKVLHEEGIIHSDLKPANFLIVAGNLKLIDFGIANAIQQDKTSVIRDTQVGTLNFMSPEAILDTCGGAQVDDNGRIKPRIKIGVKSDVWSLGCILYNMVYSRTPFQHITNQLGKLQAIINPNHRIPFPSLEDKALIDVLQSCLKREPRERPSIDELLHHSYLNKKKEKVVPVLPALKKENLAALMMQLSRANVSSPTSLNRLSEGLMEQLHSGKQFDVSSLIRKKPPIPYPVEANQSENMPPPLSSQMPPPLSTHVPKIVHVPRAPLRSLDFGDVQKH